MSSWYQKYYFVLYTKLCCCCHKKGVTKSDIQSRSNDEDREQTNTNFSSTGALSQTPRPAMSPSPKSNGTMMTFPVSPESNENNDHVTIVYNDKNGAKSDLEPMALVKVQSDSGEETVDPVLT
eukprot:UN03861